MKTENTLGKLREPRLTYRRIPNLMYIQKIRPTKTEVAWPRLFQ